MVVVQVVFTWSFQTTQ